MADIIRTRRDTAANWTGVNPILALGERGHETDTRRQKTGDGVSRWNSLKYDDGALSLKQFKAKGDGVTDDSAAILDALQYADGLTIKGEAGAVYRLAATVSFAGPVDLDLSESAIFGDHAGGLFDLECEGTGPYALTGDYTAGTTSLAVATMPAAPAPGQRIVIVSDAVDPVNRDQGSATQQYRIAEEAFVGEGSTTTSIVLMAPLRYTRGISPVSTAGDEADVNAYSTAMAARVFFPDDSQKCRLRLGEVYYAEGKELDGWAARTINLRGYYKPEVIGGVVKRAYGPALGLSGTYGARVDGLDVSRLENNTSLGQRGYGVVDNGVASTITGLTGKDCRHVYTSVNSSFGAGVSHLRQAVAMVKASGSRIIGGYGYAGATPHWSTHQDAEDVTFIDCVAASPVGDAFAFRGRNIWAESPVVRDGGGIGFHVFTEFADSQPDDDLFSSGKTLEDFSSGGFSNPVATCAGQVFLNRHARMRVSGVGKYTSTQHVAIENRGGIMVFEGRHEFTVSGEGSVDHGVIVCYPATAGATGVFPNPEIVIAGEVIIDASASTSTRPAIFMEDGTTLTVSGRLKIIVPPIVTGLMRNTGTIQCVGNGVIEYEVAGAADDSITLNTLTRSIRLKSADGSVDFNGVYGPDRTLWRMEGTVSHSGTGAEVQNVLVPGGQDFAAALAAAGRGTYTLRLRGTRTGATAGATTLHFRSAASNATVTVSIAGVSDTGTIHWTCEATCTHTAASAQYYSAIAEWVAGGVVASSLSGSNESQATPSTAFRVGITCPSGDTVIITGAELIGPQG